MVSSAKQILPEGELFYIKKNQKNPLNLSLLQEPRKYKQFQKRIFFFIVCTVLMLILSASLGCGKDDSGEKCQSCETSSDCRGDLICKTFCMNGGLQCWKRCATNKTESCPLIP